MPQPATRSGGGRNRNGKSEQRGKVHLPILPKRRGKKHILRGADPRHAGTDPLWRCRKEKAAPGTGVLHGGVCTVLLCGGGADGAIPQRVSGVNRATEIGRSPMNGEAQSPEGFAPQQRVSETNRGTEISRRQMNAKAASPEGLGPLQRAGKTIARGGGDKPTGKQVG